MKGKEQGKETISGKKWLEEGQSRHRSDKENGREWKRVAVCGRVGMEKGGRVRKREEEKRKMKMKE
jgi:hypothetical protein